MLMNKILDGDTVKLRGKVVRKDVLLEAMGDGNKIYHLAYIEKNDIKVLEYNHYCLDVEIIAYKGDAKSMKKYLSDIQSEEWLFTPDNILKIDSKLLNLMEGLAPGFSENIYESHIIKRYDYEYEAL